MPGDNQAPQSGRPRLYGRSKGRPLRPRQQAVMDSLYPKLAVLDNMAEARGASLLYMEIGFGGGEHLAHLAQQNPQALIIGAEPFLNGVARSAGAVDTLGLDNIRLHHGDGRDVIDALPDASLDRLYILFPDPWPKSRHHKRRLITMEFLDDVFRVLKPGGALYFASDIITYVEWATTRIKRRGGFEFRPDITGNWREPYPGWPGTRYEAKAKKAGRPCHYLTFFKAA